MFEVSERYAGVNGQALVEDTSYVFDFSVDMYFENPGWGVIDRIKLHIGDDDFAMNSITLAIQIENGEYK